MTDKPSIVSLNQNSDDRENNGIYECHVTRSDRYTNPDSIDNIIYENLSKTNWEEKTYRILDVGSSSGEALKTLVKRLEEETEAEFQAYALDVDREVIESASEEDLRPVMAKSQNLPFKEDSFDIVISANLHLSPDDIEATVEEIDRVMITANSKSVLSQGYEEDYEGLHQNRIS